MAYQTLLTELSEGILILTINRPDKLNALNQEVLEELNLLLDEIYLDNSIKGIILTGSGAKAFVAGADISGFLSVSGEEGSRLAKKGQDIFFKIENCPKPFIAAVNGFALGGGCELAMSCHYRIASENARFGQPEVNLGLIPGYGGTQRLTHLVGKGRAMELMMTADMIEASTAHQIGLVNHVVPGDELISFTRKSMEKILSKSPVAIGKVIAAVNACFDNTKNGYDEEVRLFGNCFGTEDMKEGVSAFLEKRKAAFPGK
jgi:enoyl-CoA hydratase